MYVHMSRGVHGAQRSQIPGSYSYKKLWVLETKPHLPQEQYILTTQPSLQFHITVFLNVFIVSSPVSEMIEGLVILMHSKKAKIEREN